MSELLKAHINKFTAFSDEEFEEISGLFSRHNVIKKENLLEEGQICNSIYFVLKGILRKFFISEKGVEQTTEFAIENWWIMDTLSYLHWTPTEFYIQAVEAAEVLAITRPSYEKLLDKHPAMEKYFRCVYQRAYGAMQMRIKFLYGFSREDLYHHFSKREPEFLQRVPQYLIASYLGITPEYLSEIRKKSVS